MVSRKLRVADKLGMGDECGDSNYAERVGQSGFPFQPIVDGFQINQSMLLAAVISWTCPPHRRAAVEER